MVKRANWPVFSVILAFLLLVGIVAGYYVIHKPISPQLALGLVRKLWQFGVAVALLSVAGGLGRRLIPLTGVNAVVGNTLQAALGLGVLSLAALAVGALGGFRQWLAAAALAGLAAFSWRQLLGWWRDWRAVYPLWHSAGRLGRVIAVCSALILLFTLAVAFAPPLKWDALVYHLVLPHIYLALGRFTYIPQIMYWGMPQNGEMLYSWAMLLAGTEAATLVGWMVGLLALAGLAGYASEKLGISPAWVCVASLVSAYTPAASLAWGYVDWLVILFGLACLLALDLWFSHGSRRLLWLAGIYAGLAFGAKYTAGVLVLGGIAAIFTSNPVFSQSERERGGFWIKLGQVFQFVVAFGLAALPWLLKNLLATGNPLYPFIFPAGAMDQLRLHLYQGGEPWGGWQDILLLPFRAALLGIEGSPGYSASIGPLLLGLGLAAWLGWSFLSAVQRKAVILASSFAVPGILIWIVAGRFSSYLLQSRLYFVFFPALAVLAGAGYAALSQVSLPGVRLGRIAGVLVAVVLLFNVWQIGMDALRIGAPQAALGLTAPDDYLAQNWGWYAPAMRAVRELPAGAKVLMLWEPRSLHCWPACEPDEVLDRWLRERYAESPGEPRSASQILHAWQQAGYTHLLFYRLGADFSRSQSLNYHPDDWQVLDKLLAQLHQIEDFGATYTLYSIPP